MTVKKIQASRISNRSTWVIGLVVLVLTNVVVFAGAAYNRSGEPEATLILTERELSLPYQWGLEKENSGISLSLRWRVPQSGDDVNGYQGYRGEPSWLDTDKLASLGFDTNIVNESLMEFRGSTPREVYLVLEYDGPAYARMRKSVSQHLKSARRYAADNLGDENAADRLKAAEERWRAEMTWLSRLFVVDAGLDRDALRSQYSDNTKYIIARGLIRTYMSKDKGESRLYGSIDNLSVRQVSIPHAFHAGLAQIQDSTDWSRQAPPRYQVSIKYGRRYEPWVTGVTVIEPTKVQEQDG